VIGPVQDAHGLHGDDAMLSALRRAAGADAVVTPEAGAWSVHGTTARAIVSPTDADCVAEVLALCSAEGWTVEPAGAGTWLDHGRTPSRPADIILSTRRMDTRIESEPADLVVGADAGVRIQTLQERLSANGQELTLDPPHHSNATIGAMIALASAGPLRASAGTPRDHVLGIEAVTGDGRRLRFGGRVVKNVAGYDAVRLLTGSRGTLGVITSVWLRVRARPVAERSLTVAGELPVLLQALAGRSYANAAALELLGPATAAALGLTRQWTLAIRLRGGRAELDDAVARITGTAAGSEVSDLAMPAWSGLARLENAARPLVRVAGLASDLAATMDRCSTCISASGNTLDDWNIAVHAAGGIVRMWPLAPASERFTEQVAPALGVLRHETEAAGGTVLLEYASPELQAVVPARTPDDEVTQNLGAGLRRVFDPAGILAPGRWP